MKKILSIALLLLAVSSIRAQRVNDELKTLIEKTFAYSPQIKETEEAVAAAELRTGLTKTAYVPTLNAGATYSYVWPIGEAQIPTGPGTFQQIRFQPNNNFNANLSMNYVVYDFGRLQASVRKSKEEMAFAGDNLSAQQLLLAAQVSQYYYALVYFQKSLDIEDSLIAVLAENKRIVEKKLEYGDALRLDLLSIQSSLDQELMRRVDMETTLRKQRVFIEFLSGIQNFSVQNTRFDFTMPQADENALVEAAQNGNFDISAAGHRLDTYKSDLRNSRSQYAPYLSINGSAGYRNGYLPNVNNLRFNYVAGAGISIPILDAVKTTQQIKINKSIIRQQEWRMETLKNGVARDVRLALTDLRSQNEKLGLMDGQLKAAQEALDVADARYKNGTSTYLELINAAYNLQRVQLQKIQLEYNRCLNHIELARLSGNRFY